MNRDPHQAGREWFAWLQNELSVLPSEDEFSHLAKHTAALFMDESAPADARRTMVAAFMETALQLYRAEAAKRGERSNPAVEDRDITPDGDRCAEHGGSGRNESSGSRSTLGR